MAQSPTQPPENKMGVMPIPKLLFSMALPIMASMLVQAFYNVVDSIFVSQISENALNAVSLSFPMQNLMISIGVGTGVGVNAILSRFLGEQKPKQANRVACTGIFLSLVSALLFVFIGLFAMDLYFRTQSDVAEIIDMGRSYLSICCIGSVGVFGEIIFERLLQSTGKTVLSMYSQMLGAVINIILDPILIFGLLGFPQMGVAGAAVATVIGQLAGLALGIFLHQTRNREVRISLSGCLHPDVHMIGRVYSIGLPSIVMGSISSVMVFGMNLILVTFTATATAVLGIYFKVQSFIFMPVFGLNNAMIPILGYNYGARRPDRIRQTIRLSIFSATAIMLVGVAVFQLLPDKLLLLFDASDDMLRIGTVALRLISISFVFAGYCIVCGSVFQAMGHGMLSLGVSVGRQLLVLLPVAWLLSLTGSLDAVWLSFPIAELASLTLSTLFLVRIYRRVIRPLETSVNQDLKKNEI